MADIRINSLPSTATSFNADDYIAIDGASAGTRKMLAATPPFTDVTLGASGPSVKSTLSARAPRQGLVFHGTEGATITGPVFGSSAFTAAFWVRLDSIAAAQSLAGAGINSTASFYVQPTTGYVTVSNQNTGDVGSSSTGIAAGKMALVVYTRSGTTGTFYVNGIASGAFTDSTNYTGNWTHIGARYSGTQVVTGFVSALAYNRALSAAEVVALYEAGAPAAADYPATAAGTTINSSVWVNNNYSTFSSANGATLSATYSGSGTQYAYAAPTFVSKYGNVIRFYYDLTLTSGQVPYVVLTQIGVKSCSATANLTAGSGNYVDLVVNDPSSATTIAINNTAASSWSIANARLTPLGLLLAPDAAQAGGGSVWYDTSGNAANITLPASGVSWNVPTSGKINNALAITNTTASTSTSTGALVVSGGVGVAGALYVGSKGQFQSNDDALSLKYSTDGGACLLAWKNTSGTTLWSIGGGIDTRQDELVFRRTTTTVLNLDSSNNATFAGNIKTAAPAGGTAAAWKLGTVASVSPTSPNRTIEVDIGGTIYYIHAKTTNN